MQVPPQRRRPARGSSTPAARPSRAQPPASGVSLVDLRATAGNAAVVRLATRRGRVIQRLPEIAATDVEMGQRVVDQVNAVNAQRTATTGVHYPHNYEAAAIRYRTDPVANARDKAYADFWKDDYRNGYADPAYFVRTGGFAWQLKPMVSAADAIKAWLKGPTIAECASVLIAIELNTLRAALGDQRFDALFSEWPNQPPEKELLRVSQFPQTSSVGAYMAVTSEALLNLFGTDKEGSRAVKKGEWYYFYNHPKYLLKHPGGAFQGENAICMDDTPGQQKWAGFGVPPVLEGQMMAVMAQAYNAPRGEGDYRALIERFAPALLATKGNQTYAALYAANRDRFPDIYREDKGSFPDTVTAAEILSAPAYEIDGTKRKGGFQSGAGKALSASKVQAARKP